MTKVADKELSGASFSSEGKDLSIARSKPTDEELVISLKGSLVVEYGKEPFRVVRMILQDEGAGSKRIRLDLGGLEFMDSSGIALIASVKRICVDRDLLLEISGGSKKIREMIGMVDVEELAGSSGLAPEAARRNPFVSFGEHILHFLHNSRFIFIFIGEILLALVHAARFPRKVRAGDLLRGVEGHGVNALPIITIVNLLVGMVLAFQAAIQLKQFGANIYVANLVGLAQTREFGPLITAILLTGRSGSAFAAEIGSMMVNEEVDALRTMGLDPVRFLVVPKVLALLLALPLLAFYADIMGILGGLLVGVLGLGLTVQGFLLQLQGAIGLFDVFSGVAKTFAFALIIAGVGCLRGFQVRGGADGVGRAATSTVVTGIFLIILADAVFTVLYQIIE